MLALLNTIYSSHLPFHFGASQRFAPLGSYRGCRASANGFAGPQGLTAVDD
jgi:hypothetical protein